MRTIPLVCLAGLAALLSSHAELITIPPGNVSSSSEIGAPFNRQDDFIVDGSGLVGGQHTPAVEPNMWLSTGTAFGGDDLDPFVMFDLGDIYTITSIHVWNYNESPPDLTARGVNTVTIEYGTTAALGSTLAGVTNFTKADGLATYAGEIFDSFAPFSARFIKFDIDTNHGGDNNFYGLSEVQFDGILGGLGLSQSNFSTAATQGDLVGTLSTPGGDPGDIFTYTFTDGVGGDDNDKFQIAGDELQIGTHDFSTAGDGEMFSVRVLSTGAPSGATVEADFALTAIAPDLSDPTILSLSPVDDAINAKPADNLVVTFDEPVVPGTGNITINNLSDLTQTVIAINAPEVTIADAVVTINPTDDLLLDKNYSVQIDATAIDDLSGNSFAGIADDSTWNFTVPASPPITLVGYWPFDADTDPQPDQSGAGNDAAVAGATWVNDAERSSGVMEFDGNNAYLEAADSPSLSLTGDLTIAAWVNVTDFAGFRGIVGKTAGPGGNLPASYDLYLVQNVGQARLFTGAPEGNAFGEVTATTAPALGEWHHIAVTRIGDDVTFYYDGVVDGQGVTAHPMLDSDATLRIGSRTDLVTNFLGRMDDVAIFDGGLSGEQVMAIMDGNFSDFGGSGGFDFKITAVSKGETLVDDVLVPSVTLTFNSRPGRNYKIEFSTSLKETETPGGWIELDDAFTSQGETTTYIDTLAAGTGTRIFYRVSEN